MSDTPTEKTCETCRYKNQRVKMTDKAFPGYTWYECPHGLTCFAIHDGSRTGWKPPAVNWDRYFGTPERASRQRVEHVYDWDEAASFLCVSALLVDEKGTTAHKFDSLVEFAEWLQEEVSDDSH